MRYFISASWALRSDQLEDFFDDSLEKEDCEYSLVLEEDVFYQLQKIENSIVNDDLKRGAKTEPFKDENGNNCIRLTREGFRYYIDIDTAEELHEFINSFGGGDVRLTPCCPVALGTPDPNEDVDIDAEFPDAWMIELCDDDNDFCDCPECES